MGSIMKPSWSPMIVSTNSKLVDIFSASRMMIDWGLRLWGIFNKTSNFLSESREAVQYIATLEFLWAICTTLYKEMPFAYTATQVFSIQTPFSTIASLIARTFKFDILQWHSFINLSVTRCYPFQREQGVIVLTRAKSIRRLASSEWIILIEANFHASFGDSSTIGSVHNPLRKAVGLLLGKQTKRVETTQ